MNLPLDFDSEVVRMFVKGDSVEIEGLYRFRCAPSRVSFLPILYPYPVDSLMGGARMVSLQGRAASHSWQALEFVEVPRWPGASWRLPTFFGDTLVVRAVYRQALRARYAHYIVTTTSTWNHPLRTARFEIYLPPGAHAPRFSYPFRKVTDAKGGYYLYEAHEFLPDRDIRVDWAP